MNKIETRLVFKGSARECANINQLICRNGGTISRIVVDDNIVIECSWPNSKAGRQSMNSFLLCVPDLKGGCDG